MRELYIVRHGEAVPHGTPGMADEDRPLTEAGERKFREAAKGLRALGMEPDAIVTSPLPRARRTAEILAEVLHMPGRLTADRTLAADCAAADIAAWLKTREEAVLAIVGHNPWCSDLVTLLLTGGEDPPTCELKKGGVALLRLEGGTRILEWLVTPRMLRKLG